MFNDQTPHCQECGAAGKRYLVGPDKDQTVLLCEKHGPLGENPQLTVHYGLWLDDKKIEVDQNMFRKAELALGFFQPQDEFHCLPFHGKMFYRYWRYEQNMGIMFPTRANWLQTRLKGAKDHLNDLKREKKGRSSIARKVVSKIKTLDKSYRQLKQLHQNPATGRLLYGTNIWSALIGSIESAPYGDVEDWYFDDSSMVMRFGNGETYKITAESIRSKQTLYELDPKLLKAS